MAPEQLEGGRIDGRADVYSLGCVLFQALTGRPPFPDDSIGALMYAHIHTPPPEAGGPLGPVLTRALAKRPDDRYPSAGAFGHAVLDAVSRGAAGPIEVIRPWVPPYAMSAPPPGLAPPASIGVPARKRSRRWLLVGGCLALVVAVGAAIVKLVPAREAVPSETAAGASEAAFPANPAGWIASSPIPVGAGPRDLADGEGYIWTANTGGGSISRVQPGTGASTEIVVDGQPNQIVVGNGTAWVWNYSSALTPVDAVTGLVRPLVYTQFDMASIAAGRDAVWFTSDAGVVGRVDMVSASVSEVFNLGGRPGSISIGDGKIYVLDRANQTLVTIDEASRAMVGAPAPVPEGLTAVYAAGKDVYLVGPSGVARLGAGPLTPDQVVEYDSGIGAIAIGPDSAWVCDELANELHRVALDLRTPVAAPLEGIGDGCGDMEVFDGLLWFANRIDGTVTRIDPAPL
jgi:streptogramin lyase